MSKTIDFRASCPMCGTLGRVTRNADHILWFTCYGACAYSDSWHVVRALLAEQRTNASIARMWEQLAF